MSSYLAVKPGSILKKDEIASLFIHFLLLVAVEMYLFVCQKEREIYIPISIGSEMRQLCVSFVAHAEFNIIIQINKLKELFYYRCFGAKGVFLLRHHVTNR